MTNQDSLLVVSSSPHLHSPDSVPAAMRDVLIALVPALIAAVYYFRLPAVMVILACVVSAYLAELACLKVMKKGTTTGELSALGKRAAVALEGGRLRLQALIDRTSLEVFAQNGLVSMSSCFLPEAADWNLEFYARGGPARLVALEVHELASAWPAL